MRYEEYAGDVGASLDGSVRLVWGSGGLCAECQILIDRVLEVVCEFCKIGSAETDCVAGAEDSTVKHLVFGAVLN